MQDDAGSPYIVVSTDSHAGPRMETQLRPYCPAKYLDVFDEHVQGWRRHIREQEALEHPEKRRSMSGIASDEDPHLRPAARKAYAAVQACGGLTDPHDRLRDMDEQGVAADVIFPGGQNREDLPFLGFGVDAGSPTVATELRAVGEQIWNRWIADFAGVEPNRLIGVMQVPIWDVDAAIEQVHAGADAGLAAVNFPAPRRGPHPVLRSRLRAVLVRGRGGGPAVADARRRR